MADKQGTGKHPHKSSKEPFPHQSGEAPKAKSKSSKGTASHGAEDGKQREYKDGDGKTHHHTRTAGKGE